MNTIINNKMHIINALVISRKVFFLFVFLVSISFGVNGQITAGFYANTAFVCSGSSVTFTNNSLGTTDTTKYLWDFGELASPTSATGPGPHTVIYTGSGKSTVSLTVTDSLSDTMIEPDFITVNAIPPIPDVTVSDDCDGTSTLTTTALGTILWSTMATSSAIIVTDPGIYSVTTTIDGCTSLPGSGTASPKSSPAIPEVSVDCSEGADEAVITILSPLGVGYEYRLDGGPFRSTTSFDEVSNGSHTITVRNALGCTTTGSFFAVSCECTNAATVTLSSTSGSTCDLTPVVVTGTFGGRATRVMITEDGDGTVNQSVLTSSPFTFNYTPVPGDEGKIVIITVRTNDPNGDECVAATETYRLTVNEAPDAPTFGSIIPPTCTTPTGSVEVRGLPASGVWTLTRNPGNEIVTGSGANSVVSGLATGTYTFTVTNQLGCSSGLSAMVTIPLQPDIPQLRITNPAILCSPASFNLTAGAVTAGSTAGLTLTYWKDATATVSYLTPASATEGTYYIKGITSAGCSDIKPVTVRTDKTPIADAGPDQVIEYDFVTFMNAEPPTNLQTGVWSVISGTGEFADLTNAKTQVTGLSQGTNVFLWTVSAEICPASSDTVKIIVNDLEIKTLLTPNMDGRNDYFRLKGLSGLGKTEVAIFNRAGVLVYENREYDNSWNGVDFNGKPLPEDTYFYVMRSENGTIAKGFVVIRR